MRIDKAATRCKEDDFLVELNDIINRSLSREDGSDTKIVDAVDNGARVNKDKIMPPVDMEVSIDVHIPPMERSPREEHNNVDIEKPLEEYVAVDIEESLEHCVDAKIEESVL